MNALSLPTTMGKISNFTAYNFSFPEKSPTYDSDNDTLN